MTIPRTVECNLSLSRDRRGNPLAIQTGVNRVPRVARLLALAVRMEGLIRAGGIADYSSVAQLGHVSRARITQMMNLLALSPLLQEELLFLSSVERGRDPIHLRQLQPIARMRDWRRQRRAWRELRRRT